jgi:hypothetical protein
MRSPCAPMLPLMRQLSEGLGLGAPMAPSASGGALAGGGGGGGGGAAGVAPAPAAQQGRWGAVSPRCPQHVLHGP